MQGVGYRPFIFKQASGNSVKGSVTNGVDGVHVIFNHDTGSAAESFANEIIDLAPSHAVIQEWNLEEVGHEDFEKFTILVKEDGGQPDILITPDFPL